MRTCSALSGRCITALAFSAYLAAMSLCSVFASECKAEAGRKDGRPNIVFILVDDLGWSDLGCYGNDFIETPWINSLADFGGIDGAADAVAVLRSACREAGFPGIIVLCEERFARQVSVQQMKAIGIDHCYTYTWKGIVLEHAHIFLLNAILLASVAWSAEDEHAIPPGNPVKVSAICIGFGGDHDQKLTSAVEHLHAAGRARVDIACLPEELAGTKAAPVPGPTTQAVGRLAKQYGMYVVCPIREQAGKEQYNTAVLIDRQGEIAGRYRKIFVYCYTAAATAFGPSTWISDALRIQRS